MSRLLSIVAVAILAGGAVGAEAHQPSSRLVTSWGLADRSAYTSTPAGSTLAQSDDLVTKVKSALKADPDLGGPSDAVSITETGGVLTLAGTVPSVQIRARIAEFVMKIDGVTKVSNKIKPAKK